MIFQGRMLTIFRRGSINGKWLEVFTADFLLLILVVAQIIVCMVEVYLLYILSAVSLIRPFLVLFPDFNRIQYG